MKERGAFDDFRVRISPAFGPLPSIFGLNIAAYILCELAGQPYLGPSFYQEQEKNYINAFTSIPCIAAHQINRLPIDEDDIALIKTYRGRSLLPPHDVPTRPTLGPSSSALRIVGFDQPDVE
ncbi:hypothetical protein BYT27DRAFT_6450980 [Phlegmacium glaucopus]|nr:hypothetical protein BYT27DRAFT_6450980 [Phlegmacium glaucopus]